MAVLARFNFEDQGSNHVVFFARVLDMSILRLLSAGVLITSWKLLLYWFSNRLGDAQHSPLDALCGRPT